MPETILVIDDDPTLLELLRRQLEVKQLEVLVAGDGEEGLKKVRESRPDLIILDVLMPKMDGYTFVRTLRREENGRDVPVIVLTAKKHLEELFREEGVKAYFTKPYDSKELLGAVLDVLGRTASG